MTAITHLDLTGFQQVDQLAWRDAQGTVMSLHFFNLRPDLPASPQDPAALLAGLARHTAGAGAGLIDAAVEPVDGVPAVRQLLKVRHPQGHGQVFIGSYTVPRATCSTVLKLQAPETGTTGMREAVVMAQLGPDRFYTPSPYAPDATGGLPNHWADHEQYDAQFPQHPLTLVRATLRRLLPSVRLDERFKALPAF
ncbi:hypothetical protein Daura_35050 [Dactylosporangium aurantiacum]|uniref:Uncharacterized protein n=1 Tax=Dactylosporangium aurantiacum TaxID=35754 RepID=A0A9Q9I9I4_9ACTN|nr:hypothetical protein [Dactylosporangium aurantiacum]MDG6103608.1 hypothetical protein [Dactylosporangium aurantiacum]UWZ51902.1 hypothetical protein Daura_35050 [Dactylosporangium aurantiacum]